MAKELERAGLPTAFITSMVPLAQGMGANRIVQGKAVTHTTGDPSLAPEEEKTFRKRLVEKALKALQTDTKDQKVFWADGREESST